MTNIDIYNALAGINEKYLAGSENIVGISTEFKRVKSLKIRYASLLCGLFVVLAATIILNTNKIQTAEPINTPAVESPADTADKTEHNTDDPQGEVGENAEGYAPEFIIPPADNFADKALEYWLNKPDVVWGEAAVSAPVSAAQIHPGKTVISDELAELMRTGTDSTIYAVMVDYSSCADESAAGDSFKETFKANNMGVYCEGFNSAPRSFLTFARRSDIEGFRCRPDEAFVFYPASKLW